MLKKMLFACVFLIAYSGAMLHSIVPHHHHDSFKEAREHHHHENDGNHSHQHDEQEKNGHDDSNPIYFLTHAANGDISITHSPEQGTFETKKSEKQLAVLSLLMILRIVPVQQIFHPPSDDFITESPFYHFRALRAPPFFVA